MAILGKMGTRDWLAGFKAIFGQGEGYVQAVAFVDPDTGVANTAASNAGVYQNSAAYAGPTTKGDGVTLSISTGGTVTFTMAGGGSMVLTFPAGVFTLPFACTNVVMGTAVGTAFKMTL